MFYFIAWLFFWPVRLCVARKAWSISMELPVVRVSSSQTTKTSVIRGRLGYRCHGATLCDGWQKRNYSPFRANYRECTEDYGHAPLIAALRNHDSGDCAVFSHDSYGAREAKPGLGLRLKSASCTDCSAKNHWYFSRGWNRCELRY